MGIKFFWNFFTRIYIFECRTFTYNEDLFYCYFGVFQVSFSTLSSSSTSDLHYYQTSQLTSHEPNETTVGVKQWSLSVEEWGEWRFCAHYFLSCSPSLTLWFSYSLSVSTTQTRASNSRFVPFSLICHLNTKTRISTPCRRHAAVGVLVYRPAVSNCTV